MRIFAASLGTETNTFSPIPTSYANFEASFAYPPGKHPDAPKHTTAPLYVARKRAAADGFTLIEGSCFWAEPSGTCGKADYEMMRDRILAELEAALPVDGVLLGLHGAMVAYGYDDCEGDLIGRVRKLAGAKAVIGCEYDLHCHLTEKRVSTADISILYKEYPHTDFLERAEELVTLVLRTIRGEIKPVTSLYDMRLISFYPTTVEPMRSFVDKMAALEKSKPHVLSVSFGHGFQHADVPDVGSRMLVITDNRKAEGDKLAAALAGEIIEKLDRLTPKLLSQEEALGKAQARNDGATVIADTSDNAGGGAASDNTDMIRLLLEKGVTDAAVGPLWDPVAVRFCFTVGKGARLKLRFGGKSGPEFEHSDRCRGRGDRALPRRHAILRRGQDQARRLRGDPHRWRRGGARRPSQPGARPRALHQCRHRSVAKAHRRGEIGKSLPRRLRPDRQGGALRRRQGECADQLPQPPLHQGQASAVAARSETGRPLRPLSQDAALAYVYCHFPACRLIPSVN